MKGTSWNGEPFSQRVTFVDLATSDQCLVVIGTSCLTKWWLGDQMKAGYVSYPPLGAIDAKASTDQCRQRDAQYGRKQIDVSFTCCPTCHLIDHVYCQFSANCLQREDD